LSILLHLLFHFPSSSLHLFFIWQGRRRWDRSFLGASAAARYRSRHLGTRCPLLRVGSDRIRKEKGKEEKKKRKRERRRKKEEDTFTRFHVKTKVIKGFEGPRIIQVAHRKIRNSLQGDGPPYENIKEDGPEGGGGGGGKEGGGKEEEEAPLERRPQEEEEEGRHHSQRKEEVEAALHNLNLLAEEELDSNWREISERRWQKREHVIKGGGGRRKRRWRE